MLIDVGGHRLYLEQRGAGTPTVVFDAGLSDAAERWDEVPARVARFTRVCLYDRAGLGRSEPGPGPRTSGRIVEELRAALRGAAVAPPYILVGHSLGGQNVRLYACRYRAEVAGLVLLDAAPGDLSARFAEVLTADQLEALLAGWRRNREGVDIQASEAEMRAVERPLDLPLIVIARGIAPSAAAFPEGWPVEALEAIWQEHQAKLAASSPRGEFWRAARSGHYIQRDEPELVVAAIRRVMAVAGDRGGMALPGDA